MKHMVRPTVVPRGVAAAIALMLALIAACGPVTTKEPPAYTPRAISEEALAALVDSVLQGGPDARQAATDSLEILDDPRTANFILYRLQEPHFGAGHEAGRALVRLGIRAGADSLVVALEDTNPFVRWYAARALGAHGVARAGPTLARALGDTALAVRRAAALALGQLGDTAFVADLVAFRHDRKEEMRAAIARALGDIGEANAATLRTMAEEDSGLVVTEAIGALGRLRIASAVPVIGVALLDGATPTRIAASHALGRIGGADADSLLVVAACEDPSPLVREAAITALSLSSPASALRTIRDLAHDEPDVFVRLAWVDALERIGSEAARGPLERLAEDDASPDVRLAARLARHRLFRASDD